MSETSSEFQSAGTGPKPFIFVLMPFQKEFNDIYTFGIKGAATDIGAYAERVDEQIFTESILDRVFNQISKADVLVADMTGRNANVFYEVGYAHALDKQVILLTQRADDIPFDLKHRPHIVYDGQISKLRKELAVRLDWAVKAGTARPKFTQHCPFVVFAGGVQLPESGSGVEVPVVPAIRVNDHASLQIQIQNKFATPTRTITHIDVLTQPEKRAIGASHYAHIVPLFVHPSSSKEEMSVRYRMPGFIASLPPYAIDSFMMEFSDSTLTYCEQCCRLCLMTDEATYTFDVRVGQM